MDKKFFTVSSVNQYIKRLFAGDFVLRNITVKGEISNLKYHGSGHIYFTLKDEYSELSVMMFKNKRLNGLSFLLKDGMSITVKGSIGVYVNGGKYQLYAESIENSGEGEFYVKFMKLKASLEEMGMFSPIYKKPIPEFPMKIGIITSSTGAAIRDIIRIAKRRNPYVELILFPALVQGEYAAASIIKGLETLDELKLDLIILGRGGGSIEDLWPFNEESVARAIFNTKTAVVSAVGHESDTVISDYVADLRAATPSAAAELCVFEYRSYIENLRNIHAALEKTLIEKIFDKRQQLSLYKLSIGKKSPENTLIQLKEKFKRYEERFSSLMDEDISKNRYRLKIIYSSLDGLSPLKKLSGGFSYIRDKDGKAIKSIDQLSENEIIEAQFIDGNIKAQVIQIEKAYKYGKE